MPIAITKLKKDKKGKKDKNKNITQIFGKKSVYLLVVIFFLLKSRSFKEPERFFKIFEFSQF